MSDNTEVVDVSTKTNASAKAVSTKLTIDWSDMSEADIKALARQSLVIKWQGTKRDKKATKKREAIPGVVPATDTILAKDHKVGHRVAKPVDVNSVMAALAKLSPEDRAAALAKYA